MLDTKTIKKILILRYRFVGDTVLAIPFIKNVKENFPASKIDILVSPNSGELIEGNPDINKVIYYDNAKVHKYEQAGEGAKGRAGDTATIYHSFIDCAKGLRSENYDLVFVLKRSFSSAVLAFLTGAKYRIGFNTELRSFLLTHSIKYDENIHELENFLNCLKPLDIKLKHYVPGIFPDENETAKANGFLVRLNRFKPKVLIHASSAHPYKMWPKRYFAKVMDEMFEKYEAQFVFTGAKIDKSIYEEILNWCENKKKFSILNLCGLTTLRECYALYKKLDLAICVDSGNAHMAAVANIPTYVLFGPTRPERWLPVGKRVFSIRLNQLLPCQPCDVKIHCEHLSCMKLLTPETVLNNTTLTQTQTQALPD